MERLKIKVLSFSVVSLFLTAISCSEGEKTIQVSSTPPVGEKQITTQVKTPLPPQTEKVESGLILHEISEDTFIETPSKRDPFRSFLIPLTKHEVTSAPQITSILDQYQVDELKLVAIISGSGAEAGSPVAMIEDPNGVGYLIRRGNYIGKSETVRKFSTGEEVSLFWKVARIREDAIVLEREDPFASTEAIVSKTIPLEKEEK